ncbi:PLDc N-terminal domain-containing protein [Oleidesulfovibrio sp.]|uniref:PLDc N-terminal domain-containing protein n=1 Tax=Oleidesulfovibrio sp. TaxID=2909707 RepID=UPI003A8ADE3F
MLPIIDLIQQADNLALTMLLLALPIVPNLWCIWHAYSNEFPTPAERLLWMGIGVFVPVIGGLAYLIFGWRRSRKPRAVQDVQ